MHGYTHMCVSMCPCLGNGKPVFEDDYPILKLAIQSNQVTLMIFYQLALFFIIINVVIVVVCILPFYWFDGKLRPHAVCVSVRGHGWAG